MALKHCNQCFNTSAVTNIPSQYILIDDFVGPKMKEILDVVPDFEDITESYKNTTNETHDIHPIKKPNITFMNDICKKFYENTLESSISNGINVLITSAFKQNARNKEALCNDFEMVYHLKNTKFIMSLPTTRYSEYSTMTSLLSKENNNEFSFSHPSSSPYHI